METIYLLKYNNYYNRIVKKENSLEDYLNYQVGTTLTRTNFNPNDYIDTELIINWDAEEPDYLLVADIDNNITSRWFVIADERTRAGQLRLQLHRDTVVDYYDQILTAPMFIEKATISDTNDPAVYNSENMTYNQIKKAEFPLKDTSGTAWIVGYVPRDSFNRDTAVTATYPYTGIKYEEVDSIGSYAYNDFEFNSPPRNLTYRINTFAKFEPYPTTFVHKDFTAVLNADGTYGGLEGISDTGSNWYDGSRTYQYTGGRTINDIGTVITINGNELFSGFTSQVMSDMEAFLPLITPTESDTTYNILMKENGKILYSKEDGQYYKVSVNYVGNAMTTRTDNLNIQALPGSTFYDTIKKDMFSGTPSANTFQIKYSYFTYRITASLLSNKVSTTISATRYHLNDSPYDMFFMPFPAEGQTLSIYKNGVKYIDKVDRDAAFCLATAISPTEGSANIYDIQLLPYCPFPSMISADGTIDIGDTLNSDVSVELTNPDTGTVESRKVSVLMWATSSQFKVRIPFTIAASNNAIDKKVKNETEFWRLCSPNYSGVFEFSPEKNNGVHYITVDCNYKPFNPYIHASIDFNGLYGQDFADSRGLICGGDFSLPLVTDAWADYQLSNKNYQQMFDRQIQNMEVNNAVQKEQEIWQVVAGTVSAGASGSAAGAMAAGPWGALAGVGTAGISAMAGVRDIQLNEKLRNEALDYTKDLYGYQLGNIQALPQGLAKVSAFTANNKIFPFLEQYGCTDIEKEALRNKIKYNGMTIMRIGSISEFIQSTPSYIKGKLIRVDNIDGDYHIINAIANELNQGVFI